MTLIIGVGNADRGDDAVGLEVARRVRDVIAAGPAPGAVTVLELDGDQLGLLDIWGAADDDEVYVIDAVCSGGTPGDVYRFNAARTIGPRFRHHDSRTLNLADVVELARELGRLPASLTGYGIEGASFDPGTRLSLQARAAAQTVTRRLMHELKTA